MNRLCGRFGDAVVLLRAVGGLKFHRTTIHHSDRHRMQALKYEGCERVLDFTGSEFDKLP
jgi:hypothetical protein